MTQRRSSASLHLRYKTRQPLNRKKFKMSKKTRIIEMNYEFTLTVKTQTLLARQMN